MPGITPQVGDILQVRVNCRAQSQLSQNVLHYRVTLTGGAGLTLPAIAANMSAGFAAFYKPWMPITASFNDLSVQNITPPITNPAVSAAGTGAGNAIGDLMPRQASGLIRLSTDFGGRGQKGRIYVGFIAGANMTPDGQLDAGGLAALTAIGAIIGPNFPIVIGPNQITLKLIVRHPNLPGPPPTPVGTDVTFIQAQTLIATQRRRGDFGAFNF